MSIAILKKKTFKGGNPRLDPISGKGKNGFALNGTLRNQGNVGQSIFENIGEGYLGLCCTNDPNVVKPSVINTKGMLAMRKIKNCSEKGNKCPKDIVQLSVETQNQYINRKHSESFICYKPDIKPSIPGNCKSKEQIGNLCKAPCNPSRLGGKNKFKGNYTKPSYTAISQNEYIKTVYLKKNCIPYPPQYASKYAHFPPNINNEGCATLYLNKSQLYDN